jgi:hypothetical protein
MRRRSEAGQQDIVPPLWHETKIAFAAAKNLVKYITNPDDCQRCKVPIAVVTANGRQALYMLFRCAQAFARLTKGDSKVIVRLKKSASAS